MMSRMKKAPWKCNLCGYVAYRKLPSHLQRKHDMQIPIEFTHDNKKFLKSKYGKYFKKITQKELQRLRK